MWQLTGLTTVGRTRPFAAGGSCAFWSETQLDITSALICAERICAPTHRSLGVAEPFAREYAARVVLWESQMQLINNGRTLNVPRPSADVEGASAIPMQCG